MNIKVGLVQFPVAEGLDRDVFFDKMRGFISDAKDHNVDLLIFPELASLDVVNFDAPLEPQWKMITEDFVHQYLDLFVEASKLEKFAILVGSTPVKENGKVLNRSWLVENGRVLVVQDKLNMTPEEELVWNWNSTADINVFEWRGIKCAILICHDSEFFDVSNSLKAEEIELFLIPSMTTDVWGLNRVRWCSMARAVEHHAYALVTGTVDAHPGQNAYSGQAAFITPQNPHYPSEISVGPYNVGALVIYDLDFKLLRATRSERTLVYPGRDSRSRTLPLKVNK